MKNLKKYYYSLLFILIVGLMGFSPVPNSSNNSIKVVDDCVAPGYVQMLATVPENCQSTVFADSQFATGANWTVTGGVLISGQGTLSIVISANSFSGSNVTVTCRAFNECGFSTNTANRTYFVSCL